MFTILTTRYQVLSLRIEKLKPWPTVLVLIQIQVQSKTVVILKYFIIISYYWPLLMTDETVDAKL